jgi:starch-binding outer membrane protein, SusD/RagB family
MRNLTFTSIGAARRLLLLLVAPALAAVQGCTDLAEQPKSALTPDNYYKNQEEVMAGLASVYAGLRTPFMLDAYYATSEVSSDEIIIPTRGQDWLDNGRWMELDRHTWAANSPAGLDDVRRIWTQTYTVIARANVVLDAMSTGVNFTDKVAVEAELRTLRAFYYYVLLDSFGGVPIVTDTKIEERARNTKAEVFDFIVSELTAARANLHDTWPAAQSGRLTKYAADAILASLYLNAGVMRRDVPSATAYNSCSAVTIGTQTACDLAIIAADRVINSGHYSLASNWRSNFTADNNLSPENILVAKLVAASGDLGLHFIQQALHYAQTSPDAWNGWATIAEVYNAFDANDTRRQIFLVGPQVNQDPQATNYQQPVNVRGTTTQLVFTVNISNPSQATEGDGARVMKFPPDPKHVAQDHGNDFTWFRLAEMYLIKAEAQNEAGNLAGALATINGTTLRSRVNMPAFAATSQADFRTQILRERLFEFTNEGKRRMDQIRHGTYTGTWFNKPTADAAHRILLPIPQTQIDANPMLTQNPGY